MQLILKIKTQLFHTFTNNNDTLSKAEVAVTRTVLHSCPIRALVLMFNGITRITICEKGASLALEVGVHCTLCTNAKTNS